MPLTDLACRAAKPMEKPFTLADGGGLVLLVSPNGSKWWRLRYRFNGSAKMLSLGVYPDVTLAEAREARDTARRQLAKGNDPSAERKKDKAAAKLAAASSFEAIALEWLARQTDKSTSTQDKNRWLLQFAIDAFGAVPIAEITPPMVLAACRKRRKRRQAGNRPTHPLQVRAGIPLCRGHRPA